uniref:Uncharacterized protein n=1 Tax=Amphimedon queenslandica TaxID=400682 RepID=A0A1X7V8P1_AMPQE
MQLFDEQICSLRNRHFYMKYSEYHGSLLQDHFAITYGIAKNSIFNASKFFHSADGLPLDCIYDILEGVAPFSVNLLLATFIPEKKYFTLEEFNDQFRNFPFGLCQLEKQATTSSASFTSTYKTLRQSDCPRRLQ